MHNILYDIDTELTKLTSMTWLVVYIQYDTLYSNACNDLYS